MSISEYQVGSRVRNIGIGARSGSEATITDVSCGTVYVRYDDGSEGSSNNPSKYYRVISVQSNCTTQMNSIVKFAKNLVLSADEKLLRKYGFKNDCGDYSCEAKEVVMAKLMADNESYLITIATQKAQDDKDNK